MFVVRPAKSFEGEGRTWFQKCQTGCTCVMTSVACNDDLHHIQRNYNRAEKSGLKGNRSYVNITWVSVYSGLTVRYHLTA